eukprot:TRINITY_DN1606_c0_g1_i1.p1 TRINITY_DN1606_c0_g1~~TRINITY_DN1606_c0_g1_i1.p1  ORF type:complete len:479 (+),score=48.51 TRINITY_DN1606_c0_g1_i1:112-1548(+)
MYTPGQIQPSSTPAGSQNPLGFMPGMPGRVLLRRDSALDSLTRVFVRKAAPAPLLSSEDLEAVGSLQALSAGNPSLAAKQSGANTARAMLSRERSNSMTSATSLSGFPMIEPSLTSRLAQPAPAPAPTEEESGVGLEIGEQHKRSYSLPQAPWLNTAQRRFSLPVTAGNSLGIPAPQRQSSFNSTRSVPATMPSAAPRIPASPRAPVAPSLFASVAPALSADATAGAPMLSPRHSANAAAVSAPMLSPRPSAASAPMLSPRPSAVSAPILSPRPSLVSPRPSPGGSSSTPTQSPLPSTITSPKLQHQAFLDLIHNQAAASAQRLQQAAAKRAQETRPREHHAQPQQLMFDPRQEQQKLMSTFKVNPAIRAGAPAPTAEPSNTKPPWLSVQHNYPKHRRTNTSAEVSPPKRLRVDADAASEPSSDLSSPGARPAMSASAISMAAAALVSSASSAVVPMEIRATSVATGSATTTSTSVPP